MFDKLKFVTGNANKVREAGQILNLKLEPVQLDELFEVQTPDIETVVEHKAHQAYSVLKCPVMVEDSGLVFDAWNGLPGALVKWFEKTVGCRGLLKMIDGFEHRRATAVCCFAIYDGKHLQIARGEVKGTLAEKPRGENGFGWDVIFIPEGYAETFGEMSPELKNELSHRKKALDKLRQIISASSS